MPGLSLGNLENPDIEELPQGFSERMPVTGAGTRVVVLVAMLLALAARGQEVPAVKKEPGKAPAIPGQVFDRQHDFPSLGESDDLGQRKPRERLKVSLSAVDSWLDYYESSAAENQVEEQTFTDFGRPLLEHQGDLQNKIFKMAFQKAMGEGDTREEAMGKGKAAVADFLRQFMAPFQDDSDRAASGAVKRFLFDMSRALRKVKRKRHRDVVISEEDGTEEGLQRLDASVRRQVFSMTVERDGTMSYASMTEYYQEWLREEYKIFLEEKTLEETAHTPNTPAWYRADLWRSVPREYSQRVHKHLGTEAMQQLCSGVSDGGESLGSEEQEVLAEARSFVEKAFRQVHRYADSAQESVCGAVDAFLKILKAVEDEASVGAPEDRRKRTSEQRRALREKRDHRYDLEEELQGHLAPLLRLGIQARRAEDDWEGIAEELLPIQKTLEHDFLGVSEGVSNYRVDTQGNISEAQMQRVIAEANYLGVSDLYFPSLRYFSSGVVSSLRAFEGTHFHLPVLESLSVEEIMMLRSGRDRTLVLGEVLPLSPNAVSEDAVALANLVDGMESEKLTVFLGGKKLSVEDARDFFTPEGMMKSHAEFLARTLQERIGHEVSVEQTIPHRLVIAFPNGDKEYFLAEEAVLLEADAIKDRVEGRLESVAFTREFRHRKGESWEDTLRRTLDRFLEARLNPADRDRFQADILAQFKIDWVKVTDVILDEEHIIELDKVGMGEALSDLRDQFWKNEDLLESLTEQMIAEAEQVLEDSKTWESFDPAPVLEAQSRILDWGIALQKNLSTQSMPEGVRSQVTFEIRLLCALYRMHEERLFLSADNIDSWEESFELPPALSEVVRNHVFAPVFGWKMEGVSPEDRRVIAKALVGEEGEE